MKVLVTGGCGFIDSHVCEFYTKRGDIAIAYDNMRDTQVSTCTPKSEPRLRVKQKESANT